MSKDYEIVYNRAGYAKEYPYTVWQKGQPAVFKTKQEAKKYAEKNKTVSVSASKRARQHKRRKPRRK